MKGFIGMVLAGMFFVGTAQAQGKDAPVAQTAPAQTTATADISMGTGYEKYAVVGEATSFAAGTTVFAVSTVSGADGSTVKHVWKKDGVELWTATLNVGSIRWRTSSRRLLTKAGTYEVAVLSADGAELGKASFTVQ